MFIAIHALLFVIRTQPKVLSTWQNLKNMIWYCLLQALCCTIGLQDLCCITETLYPLTHPSHSPFPLPPWQLSAINLTIFFLFLFQFDHFRFLIKVRSLITICHSVSGLFHLDSVSQIHPCYSKWQLPSILEAIE